MTRNSLALLLGLFAIAAAIYFGPGRYQLAGSGGAFARIDTHTGRVWEWDGAEWEDTGAPR